MRASWFQYQERAEPVWEAVAPPPTPIDPTENISFYQEHLRPEPAKVLHPSTTGWITESWFRESHETTVGGQMAWYVPLSVPQRLKPLPRTANRLPATVQPVDFVDPSYSIAQLMSWYRPIHQPYLRRQMIRATSISYLVPLQPHYGGAFQGKVYSEPTLKTERVGADPTLDTAQGVRSEP